MSKHRIEHISRKLESIQREYEAFSLEEVERTTENYQTVSQFCPVDELSTSVYAALTVPLYLELACYTDRPSFTQQLTILYDFRQLLQGEISPNYFKSTRNKYANCYKNVCVLLNEIDNYQRHDNVISADFYESSGLELESIPVEHAEEVLEYCRSITLRMIDKVTKMVRSQIYKFFPEDAPKFVQNILRKNPYDGEEEIESYSKENIKSNGNRVRFTP